MTDNLSREGRKEIVYSFLTENISSITSEWTFEDLLCWITTIIQVYYMEIFNLCGSFQKACGGTLRYFTIFSLLEQLWTTATTCCWWGNYCMWDSHPADETVWNKISYSTIRKLSTNFMLYLVARSHTENICWY